MADDLYVLARQARAEDQNRDLRAEGYSGRRRFMVSNDTHTPVVVYARTMQDAIWAAAKFWKADPRKAEFHQGCNVRRYGG